MPDNWSLVAPTTTRRCSRVNGFNRGVAGDPLPPGGHVEAEVLPRQGDQGVLDLRAKGTAGRLKPRDPGLAEPDGRSMLPGSGPHERAKDETTREKSDAVSTREPDEYYY